MDWKQVASRRVSARTTAPTAPSASSSQTNQNRSWPGVPKRYSTSSSLREMRPKSMATVVVVLPSTPNVSSTPTLFSVSSSSVRSGLISLIEPTSVVLPAPKPPAISILIAVGTPSSANIRSEGAEATDHRPEYRLVGVGRTARFARQDEAAVEQVAEEDSHDADRQVEVRGDLRNRRRTLAQVDDPGLLGTKLTDQLRRLDRHDQRDEVELAAAGPGAAAGHRVGPDHRPGVVVEPFVLGM